MPTCTLKDLKGMESFLLRSLARHLGVNKWAYKDREELIKGIMALQGENKPPPVDMVEDDDPIEVPTAKEVLPVVEHKPRIVITPISEALAAPIISKPILTKKVEKPVKVSNPVKESKLVKQKAQEGTLKPQGERPALYAMLVALIKSKEENRDVIVETVQKIHPEKSRQDILKMYGVARCQVRKKEGK